MSRKGSYTKVLHPWKLFTIPESIPLKYLNTLDLELQANIFDQSVCREPACLPAVLVPKAKESFRECVRGKEGNGHVQAMEARRKR